MRLYGAETPEIQSKLSSLSEIRTGNVVMNRVFVLMYYRTVFFGADADGPKSICGRIEGKRFHALDERVAYL